MSNRVEVQIKTDSFREIPNKEKYENDLIIALARFGYSPYFTDDDEGIAFTTDKEDLQDINHEK